MSIVKESTVLRKALDKRLIELYPNNSGDGFKQSMVIKDAEERKFKIAPAPLSKYFKGAEVGGLSDLQLIWLGTRYGIDIKLQITSTKFNELESLKRLKLIFG